MAASFAWGFLAASSLILGGAVALRFGVRERTLGLVMAFGSGVLISAVAFEHGGKLVGVVTTFGFALAFAISALE